MNKEIKDRWLAALRSGEYKQTTLYLKDDNGYCCLGVLCDLYLKDNNKEWDIEGLGTLYCEGVEGVLPEQVIAYAGLNSRNPNLIHDDFGNNVISEYNDTHQLTFSEIADLIEEQL